MTYTTYQSLEDDFGDKKLHPGDLKSAVAKPLMISLSRSARTSKIPQGLRFSTLPTHLLSRGLGVVRSRRALSHERALVRRVTDYYHDSGRPATLKTLEGKGYARGLGTATLWLAMSLPLTIDVDIPSSFDLEASFLVATALLRETMGPIWLWTIVRVGTSFLRNRSRDRRCAL